ncbi:hypothetical protein WJX84_002120 [Apatococcus fuscideae]|uniref:Uncharacterized protein n=1 Tax=Apatococcus fuscideae TaxID=2026836 RepID=A0AAW1T0P2_9CHLO
MPRERQMVDMCKEVSNEHGQWLGGQEEVSRYPSWVCNYQPPASIWRGRTSPNMHTRRSGGEANGPRGSTLHKSH